MKWILGFIFAFSLIAESAVYYADGSGTSSSGGGSAATVSNTPAGNLAASTVQGALDELQSDVDTRATIVTVTIHTGATAGAHAGSAISNTPSGNLAATNMQTAVNELQTDIDTRLTSAGAVTSLTAGNGVSVSGSTGAVTVSLSQWFFQGHIASSGSDNVDLSTSDQAAYVAGDAASLVLSLSPGSADGQIACAGTTAPSGTTCSAANEQIGVQVTVPETGYYEVCMNFAHYRVIGTSDYILLGFGIMRTAANSQTILEDGGDRQQSTSVTPENLNETMSVHLCGSFGPLTASTAYTFRLMYEHDVNNSPTANGIVTNPSATWGQPGASIRIRRK